MAGAIHARSGSLNQQRLCCDRGRTPEPYKASGCRSNQGYRDALAAGGKAFILAEDHRWLRLLALGKLRDPEIGRAHVSSHLVISYAVFCLKKKNCVKYFCP